MFSYVTNRKFVHPISFVSLSDVSHKERNKWLDEAANWTQLKWGYLSDKSSDTYQRQYIEERGKDFYFMTYANQPIGMFSLNDYKVSDQLLEKCAFMSDTYTARELTHVYIDASFRGLGLGKHIKAKVTAIMKKEEIDLLVFDTVTPLLNRFYMKKDWSREVCEGQSHETVTINGKVTRTPTTIMRI